jgi:hypothetical protein
MIQVAIGCLVASAYLLTSDLKWIIAGFVIQGSLFGGNLPDALALSSEKWRAGEQQGLSSRSSQHSEAGLDFSFVTRRQNMQLNPDDAGTCLYVR